jgi:hypothetical protein
VKKELLPKTPGYLVVGDFDDLSVGLYKLNPVDP